MKTLVLSSTLAAALAGMPGHAGEAPSARPAVKPSPMMDAMVSMVGELQKQNTSKRPLRERLDALAEFRHSPETAQKLLKVYGTERPWTVARLPVSNGRYDYVGTLAPLHYASETGDTYDWAPLTLKMSVDQASRNLTMHGTWPSIAGEDKNVRFTMRDLSLVAKQRRGASDLWFGNVDMDIASVAMEGKGSAPSARFEDIRVRSAIIEKPKTADFHYSFGIRKIAVTDVSVDNFKFAMRMTNIDKAAMAEMDAITRKFQSGTTPEERVASLKPIYKAFGKSLIQRGTAIEIDEISAAFKGNTASVKGRITLENATEADLDALPALFKKVVARFSVRVPSALLRDISTAVAAKQVSAQAKDGVANPQTVAQVSQSMGDIMIGKMLSNGYARLEKDVLVSDIEFRGGVLRINGKEITLPSFGTPKSRNAPNAPNVSNAPPVLQARRIDGRCVMPDYPEDVVRGEKPFDLSIRFVVKADGKVAYPAIVNPSQIPAYDQALLAAMEHCAYMPALVNGKPVDMPTTWRIVSEPGQARP